MSDWVSETESEFLSAKNLGNGIEEFEIAKAEDIEFPADSGTFRHVLRFTNGKTLMLNKTNLRVLIDFIGKDKFSVDGLKGMKVSLMKQKVSFQGELVDGIRIVKVQVTLS